MGNITETDYFQRLQEGMDSKGYDDDFKFTSLKRPVKEELLDLKNDVLQIVETLDLLHQSIVNLNHKLDAGMKVLEDRINKTR